MEERGFVCIIDDGAAFLDGFSRLLEWRGYRVAAHTSAESAFEDILSEDIDIVVSDVMMPGLTGLELVQYMREVGCTKPVVLMSSRLDATTIDRGKEIGVDEFVRKPFRPEEMFAAMDRAMKSGKVRVFCDRFSNLNEEEEVRATLIV